MLDIQPSLLLFEIVVLLLSVALLTKVLYGPLLRHIDMRNESLKRESDSLLSAGNEKEVIFAEANRIIAEAKKEAALIRSEAIASSKKLVNDKVGLVKSNLNERLSNFNGEIEQEKIALKNSLVMNSVQFSELLRNKFVNLK